MTAYSPGFWLKSSRIYCSSLRHRDFLLTALFTNSASSSFLSSDHLILLPSCWPCCGVACLIHLLLPFLLVSELTFTSSISSCIELSVIQCQVGSLAQPGCWAQSSHSACHSAVRFRCLLFPLTILSSVEQNDCNSAGEGIGGGRHFLLDGPLEEQRCNCESLPLHGAQGLELVAGLRPRADQCQRGYCAMTSITQYLIAQTNSPGVIKHNRECLQQFTPHLTQSGSKSIGIVTINYPSNVMNAYNRFVLTCSGQICHYLNPLCPLLGIRKDCCGVT